MGFGAIAEALFIRGFLQKRFQDKFNPAVAILVASLLFASIHLDFGMLIFYGAPLDWHHAYIAVFGGAVASTLFYRAKSIGPPIVFHIFWNLFAFII